jgi:hypothetical protein
MIIVFLQCMYIVLTACAICMRPVLYFTGFMMYDV